MTPGDVRITRARRGGSNGSVLRGIRRRGRGARASRGDAPAPGGGRCQQAAPTLTLETEIRFATAADRATFAEELAREVARLTARYHDESAPRGRVHRIVSFAYPKPPDPDQK